MMIMVSFEKGLFLMQTKESTCHLSKYWETWLWWKEKERELELTFFSWFIQFAVSCVFLLCRSNLLCFLILLCVALGQSRPQKCLINLLLSRMLLHIYFCTCVVPFLSSFAIQGDPIQIHWTLTTPINSITRPARPIRDIMSDGLWKWINWQNSAYISVSCSFIMATYLSAITILIIWKNTWKKPQHSIILEKIL